MERPLISQRDRAPVPFDPSSMLFFLRKGLDYIRQGRGAEACAIFTLAREQLPPDHSQLISTLDTFIQEYRTYQQMQQELQEVTKRFADRCLEQQTQIAALSTLLPMLIQDVESDTCLDYPRTAATMKMAGASIPYRSEQEFFLSTAQPQNEALPALSITCFGIFSVKRQGQNVTLCSNRTGQAILRYLITQSGHRASMDKLLEALLPNHDPDISIRKLRVAISALRRSLNENYTSDYGSGYILCKSEVYQLNPAVSIHTDADDFLALYQGRHQVDTDVVARYEAACRLYTGPFLAEDLYADWSFLQREQLSHAYLTMCCILTEHYLAIGHNETAITWATRALQENRCDEKAYRQLIRAYILQGRRSEALLHYEICVRTLSEELGVAPDPETVNLLQAIRCTEGEMAQR